MPPSGTTPSGRSLAAALATRSFHRGRPILWGGLGFGERLRGELAHRHGLPLHRLRNGRVQPARRHGAHTNGNAANDTVQQGNAAVDTVAGLVKCTVNQGNKGLNGADDDLG
ncbi:hypothetical protein [Streptomyces luteireticuli]|uniref:hypothetical protein n=1 Tax=Streptomyces luteireticuli TaxID=173858 RepID=UPI003556E5C8